MLEAAAQKVQELQAGSKEKQIEHIARAAELEIREYEAETNRLKVVGMGMTPEQVQAIASQVVQQAMQREPLDEGDELEQAAGLQEPDPPDIPEQQQAQAPQGAFSLPDHTGEDPEPAQPAQQMPTEPGLTA